MDLDIRGFWIVNESGACLFASRWNEISTDSTIFSGFISAIHNFTKAQDIGTLKQTHTSDSILSYGYRSGLIFVLATTKGSNEDTVEDTLTNIQDKFFRVFEPLVWRRFLSSRISDEIFSRFQEEIDDILLMKQPKSKAKDKLDKDALKNAFASLVHKKNKKS